MNLPIYPNEIAYIEFQEREKRRCGFQVRLLGNASYITTLSLGMPSGLTAKAHFPTATKLYNYNYIKKVIISILTIYLYNTFTIYNTMLPYYILYILPSCYYPYVSTPNYYLTIGNFYINYIR